MRLDSILIDKIDENTSNTSSTYIKNLQSCSMRTGKQVSKQDKKLLKEYIVNNCEIINEIKNILRECIQGQLYEYMPNNQYVLQKQDNTLQYKYIYMNNKILLKKIELRQEQYKIDLLLEKDGTLELCKQKFPMNNTTIINSSENIENADSDRRTRNKIYAVRATNHRNYASNKIKYQIQYDHVVDNSFLQYDPIQYDPTKLPPIKEKIIQNSKENEEEMESHNVEEDIDNDNTLSIKKLLDKSIIYLQEFFPNILLSTPKKNLKKKNVAHPYQDVLNKFVYPIKQQIQVHETIFKPQDTTPCYYINTTYGQKLQKDIQDTKDEIAIDVEYSNLYSYYGITCLLQISTRTDDYIIDVQILRNYLYIQNNIFMNPKIVKVQFAGYSDIEWLQRDCGIYFLNIFDIYIAANQLEQPQSQSSLLKQYCSINLEKKYQASDWYQRPLTNEQLKYARQDTHYLQYIYDILKNLLIQRSKNYINKYNKIPSKYEEYAMIPVDMNSIEDDTIIKQITPIPYLQSVCLQKSYLYYTNVHNKKELTINNIRHLVIKHMRNNNNNNKDFENILILLVVLIDIIARVEDENRSTIAPIYVLYRIVVLLSKNTIQDIYSQKKLPQILQKYNTLIIQFLTYICRIYNLNINIDDISTKKKSFEYKENNTNISKESEDMINKTKKNFGQMSNQFDIEGMINMLSIQQENTPDTTNTQIYTTPASCIALEQREHVEKTREEINGKQNKDNESKEVLLSTLSQTISSINDAKSITKQDNSIKKLTYTQILQDNTNSIDEIQDKLQKRPLKPTLEITKRMHNVRIKIEFYLLML